MISKSSKYVQDEREAYSLYVIRERAIPTIADGLKSASRRVLWVARDGKKYKTASLSGATMPLHPHGDTIGSINTLAGPYVNNIPLFKGDGAFGTLIDPRAYGAGRYTAVTVSKFTTDVMFRDIEIIPMQENYDGSLTEPVHFLPLVPTVLLNYAEGIAVGFATNILPRKLDDIINYQLAVLKGIKKKPTLIPYFAPTDDLSYYREDNAHYFQGDYAVENSVTIRITKLPFGTTHETVDNKIQQAMEKGLVLSSVDDTKRDINITVKFKRGVLDDLTREQIMKMFSLDVRQFENLTVLDFTGQSVRKTTAEQLIEDFTQWRLQWYVQRYQRLSDIVVEELQRYYDIRIAIKNNVGGIARKIQNRADLKDQLLTYKIVNIDYIADLPVYRFTEDERIKNEERIKEKEALLAEYKKLLTNETLRRDVYIEELQEVLAKYKKGYYKETGID